MKGAKLFNLIIKYAFVCSFKLKMNSAFLTEKCKKYIVFLPAQWAGVVSKNRVRMVISRLGMHA